MSRRLEEITLDGVRIPVAELTASGVDAVLSKLEVGFDMTRLDQLMLMQKHLPEFALDMITSPVKLAELVADKDLAPSEYAPVYDKACEVNSFLSQALQMYREKQEKVSTLQSAIATMAGSGGQQST